ncbi:MAG: hypothetical protein KatS3mg111_1045 [Pirellulaceae bacterium]|nr:MAG: hypothetical protein KatS3mg111_1045 [Pirellulaceae bacterium]
MPGYLGEATDRHRRRSPSDQVQHHISPRSFLMSKHEPMNSEGEVVRETGDQRQRQSTSSMEHDAPLGAESTIGGIAGVVVAELISDEQVSSSSQMPPRPAANGAARVPSAWPAVSSSPASSLVETDDGTDDDHASGDLSAGQDKRIPDTNRRSAAMGLPLPVRHLASRASNTVEGEPASVVAAGAAVAASCIEQSEQEYEASGMRQHTGDQPPRRLPSRWFQWPGWLLGRVWDLTSLWVLLAVVAAVPIVQLASLGYLLRGAANLAQGRGWSTALPGLRLAGRLGTFCLWTGLSWLPIWLVNDLAYSAQLLAPESGTAMRWRIAAGLATGGWLVYVAWAAIRGGRWWHFLWPAPWRFVREGWRLRTWQGASDKLAALWRQLSFGHLWWLGFRGAVGALLWLLVPTSMMIVGLRALEFDLAAVVGLLGALGMTAVVLYLPFLQVQMAVDNRFRSMLRLRSVRRRFRYAPWAHAASLLAMCLASLPLYLLRIEATPAELLWAPALVFVLFMLPVKLGLGAAMGYASRRESCGQQQRHWLNRWGARVVALTSVLVYVGSLYVAQLVAGQGALVMYFQHAFLVPAPLIAS